MEKALVLIDFQNEWLDKNSDYFVGEIDDVIERTNKLIKHCHAQGYKIIFTRHIETGVDEAFAPDSKNSEIISGLARQEDDTVISKNRISPYYNTGLEKELAGVREVVVAGILTNLCVRSFVQDAYDRDMDITVVKDCCVAFDEETQNFTFDDLKATREEISFINLSDLK